MNGMLKVMGKLNILKEKPMEIWSNEAQERYVLAIKPESLELFESICARERCP